MTVVIVEDDEIIREALVTSIPWQEYDITIAGSAGDGQEGLSAARTLMPDLVLTDIRMPLLDGLEMAHLLRQEFPEMRFVFLTAYTEFEYAKKALDLRGASYVVKSGDNDEIISAVTTMKAELTAERTLQQKVREGAPLLRTRFLNDLINGSIAPEKLPARLQLLNMTFAAGSMQAAVFATGSTTGKIEAVAEKLQLYWTTPDRRPGSPAQALFFISGYSDICVLVISAPGSEPPEAFYRESAAYIEQELGTAVCCGVGNAAARPADVAESYTQAISVLHALRVPGAETVLFYQSIRSTDINQCVLLDDVYAYITENYQNSSLSLSDVSAVMHISPTYLCTLLKKYRKTTFITQLSQVRIAHAQELLRQTDLKTYEVANRVGYNNSQYFSTLFKTYTGMTPSGYREGEKTV
jgi:two-component system, response regulator YesN